MRKEQSLGTDELGCLAKYLISHLALQAEIDSPNSNINIHGKNGIMFHLERRFGRNATSSNTSLDFLNCYLLVQVCSFNTEGNLQLTWNLFCENIFTDKLLKQIARKPQQLYILIKVCCFKGKSYIIGTYMSLLNWLSYGNTGF